MPALGDRDARISILRRIEHARRSRVIVYVTGDRQPFNTQIAEDAVTLVHRHLALIGKVPSLDLLLYSRGGDMLTPLRLVNLIRAYCDTFGVLIPYRAHSAATLLALGADEIVMGPLAELSPVDATAYHPLNPKNTLNPQELLPISVEDIISFLELAREAAGLDKEHMAQAFDRLCTDVSPIALGNAFRTIKMGRLIARKMLELHIDAAKDVKRIDRIVDALTRDLSVHAYPLGFREARDELALPVVRAAGGLERDLSAAYAEYAKILHLEEPFAPAALLAPPAAEANFTELGATIESRRRTDSYVFHGHVTRAQPGSGSLGPALHLEPPRWEVQYAEVE